MKQKHKPTKSPERTQTLFHARDETAWKTGTRAAWNEAIKHDDAYEQSQIIADNGYALYGMSAMRAVFYASERQAMEDIDHDIYINA